MSEFLLEVGTDKNGIALIVLIKLFLQRRKLTRTMYLILININI